MQWHSEKQIARYEIFNIALTYYTKSGALFLKYLEHKPNNKVHKIMC